MVGRHMADDQVVVGQHVGEAAVNEMPKNLRRRPVWNGVVVPYFVSWFIDGKACDERYPGAKPDFRVIDMRRAAICRQRNVCWICGKQLGQHRWFIFGPSSALSRTAVEPPSHRDCAMYATKVCPYLASTTAVHRRDKLPEHKVLLDVENEHPGVVVLWSTKDYDLIPLDPSNGVFYYQPHEPDIVEFWREGRKATREEIVQAVDRAIDKNKLRRDEVDIAWRINDLLRWVPDP